ncbi:MAG: glutathione synthase [Deltaproteobacteria bacterium]|nr:glutathione synthase [Deltaproteobacteria bacterium]
MRFLYVIDPIDTISPAGDTTVSFLRESQARGIENFVCETKDLAAGSSGSARAKALKITLPSSSAPPLASGRFYEAQGTHELSFDDVDVVWMRKDPPVDDLFLYACMLLDRHDPRKTLVLNNPSSLRLCHEKLWALQFPDLVPQQIVSARREVLKAFVDEHGTAVLKPLAFMGGMGVMVFDKSDKNLKSAIDLLTGEGKRPAIAQQYLPRVKEGDKRVIVVDGEPIAALMRVPQSDDVRANLHVGGSAAKAVIDDDDRRICARLAPELVRLGLFFVGLDVIGGVLTEVNVTSPTGVPHIDQLDGRTGKDMVSAIVMDRVEAKLKKR